MNLLNRAVYGSAFRRHGKRLRVLPVLEKGEVGARALRSWDRGTSGRWHIHCAIELPSHFDGIALENLVRDKLIDSIITLERAPQWHDVIQNSVTSVITYKYLIKFLAMNRKVLDLRRSSSAT